MAVQKYYIVPQDIFERVYNEIPTLQIQLSELTPLNRQKARHLLAALSKKIEFDEFGRSREYKQNIFDYIVYSIRGKEEPIDWESFLPLLFDAPKDVLTEKVKNEIRQARRHAV